MYKLYSDIKTREVIFESWGGSTKHPDRVYKFSDYKDKWSVDETFEVNYIQWLAWIASCSMWDFHAKNLMKWILSLPEIE